MTPHEVLRLPRFAPPSNNSAGTPSLPGASIHGVGFKEVNL